MARSNRQKDSAPARIRVGWFAIVALILAPVLAGAAAAAVVPRLVKSDYQASAQVDLYSVSGTRASYEVSSVVANYSALFADEADQLAAEDSSLKGIADAARQGDSILVKATFTAGSADAAEAGLREVTDRTITKIAAAEASRQATAVEGARAALVRAQETPKEELGPGVRGALLAQAASNLANALGAEATAEASTTAASTVADDLDVSVTKLSTQQQVIKMVGAAAATGFVLMAVLVWLVMALRQARMARGSRQLSPEAQ